MKNLSVFIDDISDKNGFKDDLHLGFTNTTKIRFKENEILFQNVDSKQIEIICAHLSKGVLMEFCKKCFVKIINKNCDYFSKYDKYKIWKLSMEHILKDVAEQNYDYWYRENIVRKELEADWYCVNERCPDRLRNGLIHFASREAYNIDSLGDKLVIQLFDEGFIQTIDDMFRLAEKEEELIGLERFGKKSYDNLISAIEESKHNNLDKLLFGLGIIQLGRKTEK